MVYSLQGYKKQNANAMLSEALITGMVTKQTEEENLPTTMVHSYQSQEEIPNKNISCRDMKVQPEQTENDAPLAVEKFKRMKELIMLEKKQTV